MPKPPKPVSELDQSTAGLQDDPDPRDIGQKQNDTPRGDFKSPKQPSRPSDRDKQSPGKVDGRGLPADDSKFG